LLDVKYAWNGEYPRKRFVIGNTTELDVLIAAITWISSSTSGSVASSTISNRQRPPTTPPLSVVLERTNSTEPLKGLSGSKISRYNRHGLLSSLSFLVTSALE